MKAIAKVVGLLMVAVFCMGMVVQSQVELHTGAVLVTEMATVAPGDGLDAIAARYMRDNTYAPRDIREFREGLIEANYDLWRERDGVLQPGDKLVVNYWRKAAE